jgi:hypothetical protein
MAEQKPPTVVDPVLVAVKITRTSGKDGQRQTTTYDAFVIASRTEAPGIVAAENAELPEPKADSKTAREFVVMPTEGPMNKAVPVVCDAAAWQLFRKRQAKRDALAGMTAYIRNTLGLPAPDAPDEVIDGCMNKK